MFALIDNNAACGMPQLYTWNALAPARIMRVEISCANIRAGSRRMRRHIARMRDTLREYSCGVGICHDSFSPAERRLILSALGLRAADMRPLLCAQAGKLALTALGRRPCGLAAIYAERLTREAAETVAVISQRVRGISVVLGGGDAACTDALYAYLGIAAVRAAHETENAGLHILFDRPRTPFRASPDSVALSLCGRIPGLPRESYTSAVILPPQRFRLGGWSPCDMSAVLYSQRIAAADEMTVENLL